MSLLSIRIEELLKTIEIRGVSESILHSLRAHIIAGKLAPGQKLNEKELASQLGVSRQPLREAFRLLENERLINSIPRKGCHVTPISLRDCCELNQVREMIELFAIDILCSKGITQLPTLTTTLDDASQLADPDPSDSNAFYEYLKVLTAFHVKLVEQTGNALLTHFYKAIIPSLARYQALSAPFIHRKAVEEHQRILRSMARKDYEGAKESLRAHIKFFVSQMEARIKKEL